MQLYEAKQEATYGTNITRRRFWRVYDQGATHSNTDGTDSDLWRALMHSALHHHHPSPPSPPFSPASLPVSRFTSPSHGPCSLCVRNDQPSPLTSLSTVRNALCPVCLCTYPPLHTHTHTHTHTYTHTSISISCIKNYSS